MNEEFEEDYIECEDCGNVYNTENNFITRPYRPVCPHCGHVYHTSERDASYYIEY